MTRPLSPPPDRNPRRPKMNVPEGAGDCHFHVFGPQRRFPLHPDNPFSAEDATWEQYLHLQSMLGFSRGILIQSGLHMWSWEHLVHLLQMAPTRLRGVAILASDTTDGEFDLLSAAGVLGARFYPGVSPPDARLAARAAERGWQGHYLIKGAAMAEAWHQ